MLTLKLNFVSDVYLIHLVIPESREISLNGNMYHFSVDYNSIDKSDILNINKYVIAKNDIK